MVTYHADIWKVLSGCLLLNEVSYTPLSYSQVRKAISCIATAIGLGGRGAEAQFESKKFMSESQQLRRYG